MGKASRAKREGRPADGSTAIFWAVLADGQIGNYLFPDMASAKAAAVKLREEMPASVVEWAQVGVTLLVRRPMRPKIEAVRAVASR
jgi:hypothetical protein